jgi:nitrite reductase/ring-hydroxylating ferredoxin subunit
MHEHNECEGCALAHSRRDFIRDALAAAFGTFFTLALVRPLSAAGSALSYPIPAADGAQIDRDHEVILVRWHNAVYAFALSCPHQRTALRWEEKKARFQCPKHHSKYQPDGTFISGRATRGMDRYSLRREGNDVVVDMSVLHKQNEDPAAYGAAVVILGEK